MYQGATADDGAVAVLGTLARRCSIDGTRNQNPAIRNAGVAARL